MHQITNFILCWRNFCNSAKEYVKFFHFLCSFIFNQYPIQQFLKMKRLQIVRQYITQCNSQKQLTRVSITKKDKIAYISMKSQKTLNVLDQRMVDQLLYSLQRFSQDPSVNVIVLLSSVDQFFCLGADIHTLNKSQLSFESYMKYQPIQRFIKMFEVIRKPVIAAVNGYALGGGFEIALLSDIIIASQKAYFGLPEIKLGLMPGSGGTQTLPKISGEKKGMKYVLTGQFFTAPEAWRLKIAEKASSQKFMEQVQAIAEKIASMALTTIILNKKSIKNATNMTEKQGLQYEKDIIYSVMNTKAAKQGISAFVNKRKPNFSNL